MGILSVFILGLTTVIRILINPIYWIMIIFIGLQYNRLYKLEKKILGVNKINFANNLLSSSIFGLLGGFIATILILILGITIEVNIFKYIIMLSLLLMLIDIRFICFSYSGSILSLISLIFGVLEFDISNIFAIIAVLHIVESLLIFIDGDSFKIPIILNINGKETGSFSINRLWPLPFAVLILSNNGFVGLKWWNILNSNNSIYLLYIVAGVIGALGYGDIAISNYPEVKIKKSAKRLFIYSFILLLLSVISVKSEIIKIITIIFSPVGHELVIYLGKKEEYKGTPKFNGSNYGIKVLDVLPNSIGDRLGLKPGDTILYLNDKYIDNKIDILNIFTFKPREIKIKYIDRNNNLIENKIINDENINGLGILVIEKYNNYSFLINKQNIFSRILNKSK